MWYKQRLIKIIGKKSIASGSFLRFSMACKMVRAAVYGIMSSQYNVGVPIDTDNLASQDNVL
jgi:hypothetical protein